ncbi:MAG: bifunctional [glutamine synthetase] adenylyltransferase/[glutamine synthetase]-adenylyl-L-tyrosine phosphorylase [Frankiaceae bacterium]
MSAGPEHLRRTSAAALLARLGFADPARAERLLATPAGRLIDPEPGGQLVAAIGDAADPDLALASLVRLVEAAGDRGDPSVQAALVSGLAADPGARQRLVGVLGASAALGEHLARHPGHWSVVAPDVVASRPTGYGFRHALRTAIGADPDAPPPGAPGGAVAGLAGRAGHDALRIAYRRCVLALAARDLDGAVTVDEVAGELADLAAATLDAALALAAAELPPGAASCRLAVVGLGKAGGRELNYVSDVDVLFVAEPCREREGAADGAADGTADEAAALRTAAALAAGLVRACSATTAEGAIWPVDAALRPEGKDGPLVRTLASHEAYYRRWARTWEFQAMLKARPLAGDPELGAAFVAAVGPLVWSAGERPGFVEDVQAMRRRVEEHVPRRDVERELKLGPGGLRDVEFAVQLLQLVHGRGDVALRSPNTLAALEALTTGGYVGRDDGARLGEAYRWLRTVEHRLQLQRLRRTHLVPTDARSLRWVARALGYRAEAVEAFERDRAAHVREVRRLHEKLFYRPLLLAVARLPADEARLTAEAATARLQALGFADPAGALRHLEALTTGVSRRAAIQRTLLPVMLGWFADAADPDAGLLSFRQVSEALGTTPWYLRLLRDESAAAERLARLLASSRYLSDLLQRAPEAVAMLGDDRELAPRSRADLDATLAALAERNEQPERAVAAIRALRRQELLRIGVADLFGLLDMAGVGAALADVAGASVEAALGIARRTVEARHGGPLPVRLAVIAMGRFGGREQGYGSDADVLFVHESDEDVPDHDAAALAHELAEELRRLLAQPAPDPPLQVDAALRPEGRQGPLTRSLASYVAYYARWSKTWEAQALLRAAPVAGDADLGARFCAAVAPIRWPEGGLSDAEMREVRRIKARVESERLPRGADPATHLKLGRGGLADVEWTAQALQLRHAHAVPALRTTATLAALRAAVGAGLLAEDDARVLERAWCLAARVRNAVLLVRGRPSDSLPAQLRELAGVARMMGYPADRTGQFVDDYRRATRRARAVVERVFYG